MYAQEHHEPKKNLLTGAIGYTYIPKGSEHGANEAKGVFVPSIGIDYFRKIHPRWDVGTMIDLELGEYLIIEKKPK